MIHREISDRKFQIDALDGLRGFAVLIVVFSHTSNVNMFFFPFLDLSGTGKSGVILFFLLSSFLLTLPMLDKGKKIFTFPAMSLYWQRRIFRIYPLYTLYLLLALITTWLIAEFLAKNDTGIPFSLDWLGFFNHIILQEGKGVTWSIAVEFKFYFILPILAFSIFFVRSYGLWATSLFFLTLLMLSQIISPQNESLQNDARLLPYMPIFLIGMFLALIQNDTNLKTTYTRNLKKIYKYLGYIGLVGIVFMTPLAFSIFNDSIPNDYFNKQFILYSLFWSFVIMSAVNVRGLIQWIFTLSILRFYGALSFSLYLFHMIFIFAFQQIDLNPYISAWLVLITSTVCAYISFKVLEEPISKYKLTRDSMSHITKLFTRKNN